MDMWTRAQELGDALRDFNVVENLRLAAQRALGLARLGDPESFEAYRAADRTYRTAWAKWKADSAELVSIAARLAAVDESGNYLIP